ncbi:unnamed protein product, partial [Coregonus sp. 'balchen']
NIVELKMYDEDSIMGDDLCSIIVFDISNLTPGKKETKTFISEPTKDELWVEFELLESKEHAGDSLSNGVLVNVVLKLCGAFQEEHKIIAPEETSNLTKTYYIIRDLETELGVTVRLTDPFLTNIFPIVIQDKLGEVEDATVTGLSAVPLQHLPDSNDFKVSLPVGEKRKVLVGQALQKELGLSSPPDPKKVPVIAVVGSGGGTRAMTGLYGSLKGLRRLGLLDAVSYITGVSGSTWALAALYQEADWSQRDMDESISAMEGEISKSFLSAFTPEKLQYYRHQMAEKEKEGHMVSVIDMWGLVIKHCLHGKKNTSTLSDQQKAVSAGQNPLPICTAVNLKDGVKDTTRELEWCEFTRYEVGIPKYGAYVHAKDFGSEFYLSHLVKKHPEIRTSYLLALGICTNTASALTSLFNSRPVITKIYNFMRGFFLHWNYNDNSNFTAWKADSTFHLADSGFSINTGCPPVLRPERGVDVIMSLNYSWCEDQFKVLKRTEVYCKDHSIPFPCIDFSSLEGQPLKELYVFEDEKNPKAPIALHFPFVNISFKEFKAPGKHYQDHGVAREGEEEMKTGDVDVNTSSSPYLTTHLTYAAKDFRALTDLTSYNIQNNKEKILQALRKVLERKGREEDSVKTASAAC